MKTKEEEESVYLFMPKALKLELQLLAKREGKTLKDILNEQAAEYVKVHKEGNPQHLMLKFLENEDFKGFPAVGIEYDKKKDYTSKYLQKDGRLNNLGKELLGHITQWHSELMKH